MIIRMDEIIGGRFITYLFQIDLTNKRQLDRIIEDLRLEIEDAFDKTNTDYDLQHHQRHIQRISLVQEFYPQIRQTFVEIRNRLD